MPPEQTVQPNVYISPKRKRDATRPTGYSPSSRPLTPSLKVDLPLHSAPEDEKIPAGDGSPRTAVAGRFQNLHIQSTGINLDLREKDDGETSQKRSRLMDEDHDKLDDSNDAKTVVYDTLMPRQQDSEGPGETAETAATEEIQERAKVEVPVTPRLSPEPSQYSALSPPNLSEQPPPRKAQNSAPRSPPPTDSLTWQDSEITGHAPTDPLDDGYGINGIGFRPTPAVAYARAQKRTQQIQDWRSREAREARQRRSERRRGLGHGASESGDLRITDQRRRVRFYEG